MTEVATSGEVGLAELVAALSLGIDLGFGQPMEHVLRQCWIALRLGEEIGLDEDERSVVYYTALMVGVACHTDAHEQAKWFGDDIALKATKFPHPPQGVRAVLDGIRLVGAGHPAVHRFRVGVNFALSGHREVENMISGHAAMARVLATELGLPPAVQDAVGSSYEQWDGKGYPGKLSGEAIPIASRLSQVAELVEVAERSGGVEAAQLLSRKLAGSQFDPLLAEAFARNAAAIVSGLNPASSWDDVIAAEPRLTQKLSDEELDSALGAIADFVDLKSPYTLGHAPAVAQLVAGAGEQLALSTAALATLRRAGLVQGLGRLGISNGIWDKPGPLGTGEWERVRLQPYLTERMLRQSPGLAPIGALAAQLRERLDGSGYPRGLAGEALPMAARVLAAADVYQAMLEPRPHRPARAPDEAATELRRDARSGRLDGDAVEAVLVAAGHRRRVRRERPGGLTEREIEVLRLAARGMSSKEIATELVISPKTARNHIEHIYVKIGATSRVAASHYAIKHGLLEDTSTA